MEASILRGQPSAGSWLTPAGQCELGFLTHKAGLTPLPQSGCDSKSRGEACERRGCSLTLIQRKVVFRYPVCSPTATFFFKK